MIPADRITIENELLTPEDDAILLYVLIDELSEELAEL